MKKFKLPIIPFIVFVVIAQTAASGAVETERLGEIVGACGECHGDNGISKGLVIPNLAGQDRTYLENQIEEFRHKPRKELEQFQLKIRDSHTMDNQSTRFDADELAAITGYFSDLRCPEEDRAPVQTTSIRCGECHGNDGISRKPGVPNLAGQKEAYLLAQLKMFKATILERNKVRPSPSDSPERSPARRYHRTMGQWAARLSEQEMIIAAKYYSSLPGIWVCK